MPPKKTTETKSDTVKSDTVKSDAVKSDAVKSDPVPTKSTRSKTTSAAQSKQTKKDESDWGSDESESSTESETNTIQCDPDPEPEPAPNRTRDSDRRRITSVADFRYDEFLSKSTPVNTLSDIDLVRVLVARAHTNSQTKLKRAAIAILKAINLEGEFPETPDSRRAGPRHERVPERGIRGGNAPPHNTTHNRPVHTGMRDERGMRDTRDYVPRDSAHSTAHGTPHSTAHSTAHGTAHGTTHAPRRPARADPSGYYD